MCRRRLLRITVLLVLSAVALSGWFKWGWDRYYYEYWPRWYGRGRHLPPLPYTVLVGPVKPDSGIRDVVELGMRRSEVEKRLGKALVPELSREETERKRVTDASGELYQGVFAWVVFSGNPERVVQIEFDLCDFQRKFGGQMVILMQADGAVIPLRAGLAQKDVWHQMRKHFVNKLRVGTGRIELESGQAVCTLRFDRRGNLCAIELCPSDALAIQGK